MSAEQFGLLMAAALGGFIAGFAAAIALQLSAMRSGYQPHASAGEPLPPPRQP